MSGYLPPKHPHGPRATGRILGNSSSRCNRTLSDASATVLMREQARRTAAATTTTAAPSPTGQRRSGRDDPASLPPSHRWVNRPCFAALCTVMGKSWAGNGTTSHGGEPIKEWITRHVDYGTCPDAKVQLATYYMGTSVAQAMRRGAMVYAAQEESDGSLSSAFLVTEMGGGGRDEEEDGISARNGNSAADQDSSSAPSSIRRYVADWWWEFGVTVRLLQFTIPALLRCETYQRQMVASAVKSNAVANALASLDDEQSALERSASRRGDDDDGNATVLVEPAMMYYWKIDMIGIDPDRQGRGRGKGLVMSLLAMADELDVTCRLEAAGNKNISFYEGLGFVVRSQRTIQDPTIGKMDHEDVGDGQQQPPRHVHGTDLRLAMMSRSPIKSSILDG